MVAWHEGRRGRVRVWKWRGLVGNGWARQRGEQRAEGRGVAEGSEGMSRGRLTHGADGSGAGANN